MAHKADWFCACISISQGEDRHLYACAREIWIAKWQTCDQQKCLASIKTRCGAQVNPKCVWIGWCKPHMARTCQDRINQVWLQTKQDQSVSILQGTDFVHFIHHKNASVKILIVNR